ncbi:MAG: protein kinase domain-containing protein [Limnohabitans sp.]
MEHLRTVPHANVVACVGSGEVRMGSRVCLPLQLCTSVVLEEVMATRGLGAATLASYFSQAAAGLAHCHAHGVFHLDVKPDNMLVAAGGVLKIADFGCGVLAPAPVVLPAAPAVAVAVAVAGCESGGEAWWWSPVASAAVAVAAVPCAQTAGGQGFRTTAPCGTMAYSAPEAVVCQLVVGPGAAEAGTRGLGGEAHWEPEVPVVDPAVRARVAYDAASADVWSLGVSMLVAATGLFPWDVAHGSDARYAYWAGAWGSVTRTSTSGAGGAGGARVSPAGMERLVQALHRLVVDQSGRQVAADTLALLALMLNPCAEARVSMQEVVEALGAAVGGSDGSCSGCGSGCGSGPSGAESTTTPLLGGSLSCRCSAGACASDDDDGDDGVSVRTGAMSLVASRACSSGVDSDAVAAMAGTTCSGGTAACAVL